MSRSKDRQQPRVRADGTFTRREVAGGVLVAGTLLGTIALAMAQGRQNPPSPEKSGTQPPAPATKPASPAAKPTSPATEKAQSLYEQYDRVIQEEAEKRGIPDPTETALWIDRQRQWSQTQSNEKKAELAAELINVSQNSIFKAHNGIPVLQVDTLTPNQLFVLSENGIITAAAETRIGKSPQGQDILQPVSMLSRQYLNTESNAINAVLQLLAVGAYLKQIIMYMATVRGFSSLSPKEQDAAIQKATTDPNIAETLRNNVLITMHEGYIEHRSLTGKTTPETMDLRFMKNVADYINQKRATSPL